MSYSSVYQRHQSIVNYLRKHRSQRPRTADLRNHLGRLGIEVSLRTVERDIIKINEELGMRIVRCGSHPDHWYELDENDTTTLVGDFLDHALLADMMREELAEREHGEQVMFLDGLRPANGLEHMPLLARAARTRHKARIVHRKFGEELAIERIVCPLFLKQFQQRWYLVARESKGGDLRSFGLERIEEAELLPETFRPRKTDTHNELYGHVFGLFEREHDPVLVRLWSSRFHANYLRTLPLHPSQGEEPEELDGGVVFTFFLTPNYEFLQAILKMETHVQLLSPERAVNELREILKEMWEMYT